MRSNPSSVLSGIASLCVFFVCAALYCAFGFMLILGYSFLSGGIPLNGKEHLALIAPIILVMIVGLSAFAFLQKKDQRVRQICKKYLLIVVGYLGLPILLNGVSIACAAFEWETASSVAFALRFWSFLIVPILACVMVSAYARLRALRWNRGMKTPPTNPPQPPFREHHDRRPDNNTDGHFLRISIA